MEPAQQQQASQAEAQAARGWVAIEAGRRQLAGSSTGEQCWQLPRPDGNHRVRTPKREQERRLVRMRSSLPLSPEQRFGGMALPLLGLAGVVGFVAPVDSLELVPVAFVVGVGASRCAAVFSRIRYRRPRSVSTVLWWLWRDLLGAAGFFGLYFLGICGGILLSGAPGYGLGPLSEPDGARLAHFTGLLATLLPLAFLLTRRRAACSRPLALPKVAAALRRQRRIWRVAFSIIIAGAGFGLIQLNGGLSPDSLPASSVCRVVSVPCRPLVNNFKSTALAADR